MSKLRASYESLQIGLVFPWYPLFSNSTAPRLGASVQLPGMLPGNTLPIGLSDLNYERSCVLLGLAGLYCALGSNEDLNSGESMKRAAGYFQNAAGVLHHLEEAVVKSISATDTLSSASTSNEGSSISPDLSNNSLKALQDLCLAQAQECFWLTAVKGSNLLS